jgi:uncharacterized protein (TIGR02246 family)
MTKNLRIPMSRASPADLDHQFAAELSVGDLDALLSLYEPNGIQVRQDGTVTRGRDELRRTMESFAAMRPDLSLEVIDVVPFHDGLAVVLDRWTMRAAGTEGPHAETDGVGVHIARRQANGDWLFVATGLGNLIPPA